jgi:hypothetical protein
MKRTAILSLACVLVLLFATFAFAGDKCKPPKCPVCDPCIFKSSKHQLPEGKWSETFVGGGEGQSGNLLCAQGDKVWKFEGATLEDVDQLTEVNIAQYQPCFLTRYVDGTFTLNKLFNKCCKKPLVATGVTAFNYACKDPANENFLTFTIKLVGEFENCSGEGVRFEAIGHYAGEPKRIVDSPGKMFDCLDSVELFIYGNIADCCVIDENGTIPPPG